MHRRPLDLNTTDARTLAALPGLGRDAAERIVARRPYVAKEELLRRGVVDRAQYDAIAERVTVRAPGMPEDLLAVPPQPEAHRAADPPPGVPGTPCAMGPARMATAPRRGFLARLIPVSEGSQLFDLFEQHAERTREAAGLLAAIIRDGADPERHAELVKMAEHAGDEITHTVIERLHQTFITPIDRGDIHELISRMDDVLDLVEASSERIWLYDIRTMDADARDLADVLEKAVVEMGAAVRGLRDLKDRPRLLGHCTEINRLENVGDQLLRRAMARLFRESSDPIHVIKWKEIYDYLENAIDRCEDVANVIEGVALEYS